MFRPKINQIIDTKAVKADYLGLKLRVSRRHVPCYTILYDLAQFAFWLVTADYTLEDLSAHGNYSRTGTRYYRRAAGS